jgi:hypothetical protein
MRADRTYPMHPAHANDGSAHVHSTSRFPKQFVFSQTPGTGHCKMHYTCNVMQCNVCRIFSVPGKSRPAKSCASKLALARFSIFASNVHYSSDCCCPPSITLTEQADRHKNCSPGCTCQFSSRGSSTPYSSSCCIASRPPLQQHVGFSAACAFGALSHWATAAHLASRPDLNARNECWDRESEIRTRW